MNKFNHRQDIILTLHIVQHSPLLCTCNLCQGQRVQGQGNKQRPRPTKLALRPRINNRDGPKFGERRTSAEEFGRTFGSVRLDNV